MYHTSNSWWKPMLGEYTQPDLRSRKPVAASRRRRRPWPPFLLCSTRTLFWHLVPSYTCHNRGVSRRGPHDTERHGQETKSISITHSAQTNEDERSIYWPISTLNWRTSGFVLNCFWHCLQVSLTGPKASGGCWVSCGFVTREAGTNGETVLWLDAGTALGRGLYPSAERRWAAEGWRPMFGLW